MTSDETTVVAALTGATIVTYVNKIATKQPLTIKPVISVFVGGAILLGIGTFSPTVANLFAILILTTSLAVNGKPFFDALTKIST